MKNLKRPKHLLKTPDEAFNAFCKMGMFEFKSCIDGLITYSQVGSLNDEQGVYKFEVTFYHNIEQPIFKFDCSSDFLNYHEILEIEIISIEMYEQRETIYLKQ